MLTFELVEVTAQNTGASVSVSRSGSVSNALEVVYDVRLFDAQGVRLDTILGETTVTAGQMKIELTIASLGLPSANTFDYAEFVLIADGNDYVLADNHKLVLETP